MMIINVSEGFENYSQRNNEINPNSACGPTNMIQGLEYSGWSWDNSMFPDLKQPEDKLLKFCRTNKDVLEFFKKNYKPLYENWMNEANELAEKQKKEFWQVECIKHYAPNELHDVMSYATNLFVGYTAKEIEEKPERPVTRFYNEFNENKVAESLLSGLPVVSSVYFRNGGHYITIVGFEAEDSFKDEKDLSLIKEYIIDNTYGKFNFKTNNYEAVSGNDEKIERDTFLSIVKPITHYFNKGC